MRPIVICDIDCTLYSYCEFIQTNFMYPAESMRALFSVPTNERHFPAVERTWKIFEQDIMERISGISKIANPHADILFLSAFPAEDYKKKTFEKLSLEMTSSFPQKKINLLKQKENLKVLLTIGDRPNDKGISQSFGSKLVYLPIYKMIHASQGPRYTSKLLSTIQKVLTP